MLRTLLPLALSAVSLAAQEEGKEAGTKKLTPLYDAQGNVAGAGGGGGAGGKFGGRGAGLARLNRVAPELGKAIENGTSWLIKRQSKDGRFDPAAFLSLEKGKILSGDPGEGVMPMASTAVCMLVLSAQGTTLQRGAHVAALREATHWLRLRQDAAGRYAKGNSDFTLALYAMTEVYGLTPAAALRPELEKALEALRAAQLDDGGFGEAPDAKESALVPSFFALMSLRTAGDFRLLGDADRAALTKLKTWWQREVTKLPLPDQPLFRSEHPEALRDALWLSAMFFCGNSPRKNPAMGEAAKRLVEGKVLKRPRRIDSMLQSWATMALYQVGGTPWRTWSKQALGAILESQGKRGNAKGSWKPVGPGGKLGGRLWCTALNSLALQCYYRYTRLVR